MGVYCTGEFGQNGGQTVARLWSDLLAYVVLRSVWLKCQLMSLSCRLKEQLMAASCEPLRALTSDKITNSAKMGLNV